MSSLIIKKNNEIDETILDNVLKFDRKIFPVDEDYYLPDDYLKRMYNKTKDGLFVLFDENIIVGYVNCIFLSDEIKNQYLKTKDYLMLENAGFNVGKNNMYFYTLALDEKYRDTDAVKFLMKSFSKWLYDEIAKGKTLKSCISEAVTQDGIKTLKAMGMIPSDVDENGLGIYYSSDCLERYINEMISKDVDDRVRGNL